MTVQRHVELVTRPSRPNKPPEQWSSSFNRLGVLAQYGRQIEVCTPRYGNPGTGEWERIYLNEDAARKLLQWLPVALAFALGEDDDA